MDETRPNLTPQDLDPRAMYCVVSDVQMRESTVVRGAVIQQEESEPTRIFRRFQPSEPIWDQYVRVHCDGFVLAVWRDPSRPELRAAERGLESFVAETITDPEAASISAVVESSSSDVPWQEAAIRRGAQRTAETLYVQP